MAIKTRQQLADQDENVLLQSGVVDNISALDHRTSNIDHSDSTLNKLDDSLGVEVDLSNQKRLGATTPFDHTQGSGETFVTFNEAETMLNTVSGSVETVNGESADLAKNIQLTPNLSFVNITTDDRVILLQLSNQNDTLTLPKATTLTAGLQSGSDKTKSDKYPSTATAGKMLQGDGTNYIEVDAPTGSTDLSVTNRTATTLDVASDNGTDATVPPVNATEAGLMPAVDKVKLDKYPSTATAGKMLQGDGTNYIEVDAPTGSTDLSVANRTATTLDIASSSGLDATIPESTTTLAGLQNASDKTKIDKYPTTTTLGKYLKGNGTDYVEGDVDWTEVQNKPTTFTPSAHTHPISDITNLQTTLDAKELIIVPYISKPDLTAINPTTERRILVSISANATLSFSRALVNGESGVINILNTVATSSTITLPANSIVEGAGGAILVTTGILNSRDRVTWEYDGVKIWWTYGENYN